MTAGLLMLAGVLAMILAYGRRLDDLICDPNGKMSPAKIGTIVAGAAWTHFMVTERPQSIEMWMAFYCAVAVTELFKKFLAMWFGRFTGGAPLAPPTTTATATVSVTSPQPAATASEKQT